MRLTGAQITLIEEALTRMKDNSKGNKLDGPLVPRSMAIEELVEDILKIIGPDHAVTR